MNGFYVIYVHTANKKHWLMRTNNQAFIEPAQILLEQMRKNGLLAPEITSVTVEFEQEM